jgi:hypothetical protein
MWAGQPQQQAGAMSNSDYHFGYLYRQQHAELVQEAAERRLAASVANPYGRRLADWWQGLVTGRRRPVVRHHPARLQSARP